MSSARVLVVLLAVLAVAGSSKPGRNLRAAASDGGITKGLDEIVAKERLPDPKQLRGFCDRGDLDACEQLAAMLAFGKGVARDEVAAAQLDLSTCDKGSGSACAALAIAYWEGRGVIASDEKARALVARAMATGGAVAIGEFGNLYGAGLGLPRNDERAQYLLTLACDASDARSCADLATLSLTPEPERARLADKACTLGSSAGCERLRQINERP